jgi:hypothetical protein
LSRKRKSHGKEAAAEPAAPAHTVATAAPPPPAALPTTGQRIAVKLAALAVIVWTLGLAALTLFTANPTTIGRDQVMQSDAVVTAQLVEAGRDRVRVEQVLLGEVAAGEVISVLNLLEVPGLSIGMTYLLPLSQFREDYVVTTFAGQQSPPLIYPATPETIAEAKQALRESRK